MLTRARFTPSRQYALFPASGPLRQGRAEVIRVWSVRRHVAWPKGEYPSTTTRDGTPVRRSPPRRSCSSTAPEALAGRWELPGGKVEPGEDPTDALHRELAEELGVRVRVGEQVPGPLADRTWPLTGRYVMAVTLVAIGGGRPEPLEDHDELRWLDVGDWRSVPWLAADLPIVGALKRFLGLPQLFLPGPFLFLAFSLGIHYCLGAPLALLEMELLLAELDLGAARDKRISARNDVHGDRRPELYSGVLAVQGKALG